MKKWVSDSKTLGLGLMTLLTWQTGCLPTPEQLNALEQAFEDPFGDPGAGDPVTPNASCYVDHFQQPDAEITKKIDILFVTDTSGSLSEEKAAIADGIVAFIDALPADADYQVAVMLGHSTNSSWAGKLYKNGTVPAVLKSATMTTTQIKDYLRANMNQPSETASDGGELVMASLNRGMDDDKLAQSRSLGFFRTDAALAVVLVADENDICATYPVGVTPVPDPEHLEVPAKASFCTRNAPASTLSGKFVPAHLETIHPSVVYEKLQVLQQGRPLLVSGVVYNNLATVPHVGENEYGYGHLDLIALAHGISVDMAGGQYTQGLADIGSLVTVTLHTINDFVLSHGNVDAATIEAFIQGTLASSWDYDSVHNKVHINDAMPPQSMIDIRYCEIVDPNTDPGGGSGGSGGGTVIGV